MCEKWVNFRERQGSNALVPLPGDERQFCGTSNRICCALCVLIVMLSPRTSACESFDAGWGAAKQERSGNL